MKNLLIIGAGGFGREVLVMALDNPAHGLHWRIKGFLDDRPEILNGYATDPNTLPDAIPYDEDKRRHYRRDYPIIGSALTYKPEPQDVFLCALGAPADRRHYSQPILDKGGTFISLIHPLSAASTYATVGEGCIVGPYASLSPDVKIGRFVTINSYTAVSHDASIGDWSEIGGHCLIAGRVTIGQAVRVHPGTIVTPDVRIGDEAVIAAGSVVFGGVPPRTTVLGNPARRFDWKSKQQPKAKQ